MTFSPLNRHVLLFPVEEEEPENPGTILVPDDYIKVKSPYEVYKIIEVANDCEKIRRENTGQEVVVNGSMVEEIKVHGITYYLLLENYVYGTLTKPEDRSSEKN